LILGGKKIWEMRSRPASHRGRIALIRKGSGTVVGIADLVDCIGPLDAIAWRAHADKHCIPSHLQEQTQQWNTAWVLADVVSLKNPVRYTHKSGAVTWVLLDERTEALVQSAATSTVALQRSSLPVTLVTKHRLPSGSPAVRQSAPFPEQTMGYAEALVPVAKDGTWFSPGLKRLSGYTIGAKGEEIVVEDYQEALKRLRQMSRPHWRRPNPKGNWGIVTGIQWKSVSELMRETKDVL